MLLKTLIMGILATLVAALPAMGPSPVQNPGHEDVMTSYSESYIVGAPSFYLLTETEEVDIIIVDTAGQTVTSFVSQETRTTSIRGFPYSAPTAAPIVVTPSIPEVPKSSLLPTASIQVPPPEPKPSQPTATLTTEKSSVNEQPPHATTASASKSDETKPSHSEPRPSLSPEKPDPTHDDDGSIPAGNKLLVETTGWVDPYSQLFADMAVYHHNVHRFNHSAAPVTWNATLAKFAQQWAEACELEEKIPEGLTNVGMNVAFGTDIVHGNPSAFTSGQWYNSELDNFPKWDANDIDLSTTYFNGWGHFSQLVWNETSQIGCGAFADCHDQWKMHSGCFYYPPGNYMGSFKKVHRPLGRKTVYPNGETKMAGN